MARSEGPCLSPSSEEGGLLNLSCMGHSESGPSSELGFFAGGRFWFCRMGHLRIWPGPGKEVCLLWLQVVRRGTGLGVC